MRTALHVHQQPQPPGCEQGLLPRQHQGRAGRRHRGSRHGHRRRRFLNHIPQVLQGGQEPQGPRKTYILRICGSDAPTQYPDGTAIEAGAKHFSVPVKGVAVGWSTPYAALELLGLEDELKVVDPQYIHSPCLHASQERRVISPRSPDGFAPGPGYAGSAGTYNRTLDWLVRHQDTPTSRSTYPDCCLRQGRRFRRPRAMLPPRPRRVAQVPRRLLQRGGQGQPRASRARRPLTTPPRLSPRPPPRTHEIHQEEVRLDRNPTPTPPRSASRSKRMPTRWPTAPDAGMDRRRSRRRHQPSYT